MSKATLTKRTEFCSSHRYHNPNWDHAKNQEIFGSCNNEPSHGHNYMLEVTLCGAIDPINGMIINLYDLKIFLWDVLKEFDHKNLNLDTPYFTDRIPTTENLAVTLWRQLEQHPQMPPLDRVRLSEDQTLFADMTAALLNRSPQIPHADITRRYQFSAAHDLPNGYVTGHNYTVEVTVTGPIAADTGQVVNLETLDQLVEERVVRRFANKNISLDKEFENSTTSEAALAAVIWDSLQDGELSGKLSQVAVSEGTATQAVFRG